MNSAPLDEHIDYQIERLLIDWWLYEKAYRGGPTSVHASSIYRQMYLARSGYDSASEMLDEQVQHVKFDAVRGAFESLSRDHREAIEIRMMCITTAAVWRSNRLGDRVEELYAESKVLLLPLLRIRRIEF